MTAPGDVAVIDYGSGNLRSAAKALERAAAEIAPRRRVVVTDDPAAVGRAGHVVLPGVGAFGDCMAGLGRLDGMRSALERHAMRDGKPFLGICVGMQLMADRGLEHGMRPGLGWIAAEVRPLESPEPSVKIPHMGWNELDLLAPDHPLLAGIDPGAHAYFVHGYGFHAARPAEVLAATHHGGPIAALIGRDNLAGAQFHPEKSQAAGLTLLRNFLRWRP